MRFSSFFAFFVVDGGGVGFEAAVGRMTCDRKVIVIFFATRWV